MRLLVSILLPLALLLAPPLAGQEAPLPATYSTVHDAIPNFGQQPSTQSVRNGPWSDVDTWSGQMVPGPQDIVLVRHDVVYDGEFTAAVVLVEKGGTLRCPTDRNSQMVVGTYQVVNSGWWRCELSNPELTSTWLVADVKPSDPGEFSTGILSINGNIFLQGAPKDSYVVLAQDAAAGATQLVFERAPQGWRAGDLLQLIDTRHLRASETRRNTQYPIQPQWEQATIARVEGATVTLVKPLQFSHTKMAGHEHSFVQNLTRNIKVTSQNPAGNRGHILLTGRGDEQIWRNVQLANLGRTKNQALIPQVNTIGRYLWHAHHLFGPRTPHPSGYQYELSGSALYQDGDHNFKWLVAIHDSHFGLIKDNVGYNAVGGGFVTEQGNETRNVFENNVIVRVSGSGDRGTGHHTPPHDDWGVAHTAAGFWLRGPDNSLINNRVANVYSWTGPDASYGYEFFFWYVGKHHAPINRGDDSYTPGQYRLVDPHDQAIREFRGNKVYASESGLTLWWVGTEWLYPRTACSVLKDTTILNVNNNGTFGYESKCVTYDGYTVLGSIPPAEASGRGIGWYGGDYLTRDVVIRNARIEGMGSCIYPSTSQWHTVFLIEHSTLKCGIDVEMDTIFTSASVAWDLRGRPVVLKNTKLLGGTKYGLPVVWWYNPNPTRHLLVPNTLTVIDHNQQPGDTFQNFPPWTIASQVVPKTIDVPGVACSLCAAPRDGMTNAQLWAETKQALWGGITPCTTTRAGWQGFVCPLAGTEPVAKVPQGVTTVTVTQSP